MEKYCLNLPYAEVGGKISQTELNELMEIYAGERSEFSLYCSYNYGYYLSAGNLRRTFYGIATNKKTHIDILSEAIVNFGGLPLLSGKQNFWTGKNVIYCSGKSMLSQLIEQEKIVIGKYELLISISKNQSLKRLLSRITMDGQLHLTILKSLI